MKRIIYLIPVLFILITPVNGIEIDTGIMYGSRTVSDSEIKDIYGNGSELNIYLDAKVWKGFTIGAALGTGYSESGTIGLYNEGTTLKIKGFEIFVAWQFKLGKFVPYLKTGFASLKYEQEVDSEFAVDISETKSTMIWAGGIKFYPVEKFFINIEIKYIPLKVTPLNETVDLSGINLFAGIGVTF